MSSNKLTLRISAEFVNSEKEVVDTLCVIKIETQIKNTPSDPLIGVLLEQNLLETIIDTTRASPVLLELFLPRILGTDQVPVYDTMFDKVAAAHFWPVIQSQQD